MRVSQSPDTQPGEAWKCRTPRQEGACLFKDPGDLGKVAGGVVSHNKEFGFFFFFSVVQRILEE